MMGYVVKHTPNFILRAMKETVAPRNILTERTRKAESGPVRRTVKITPELGLNEWQAVDGHVLQIGWYRGILSSLIYKS